MGATSVVFSAPFLASPMPSAALIKASPKALTLQMSSHSTKLQPMRAVASSSAAAGKTKELRGIMKPRKVSPEMADLVGAKEISRTQVLKLIWAYIKEHNLQDPENKKVIICDEKLKRIFGGKESVGFLEIAGLISPHFLK